MGAIFSADSRDLGRPGNNVTFEEFFSHHRQRLEKRYQASRASRWSVPLEDFAQAVWKGLGPTAAIEPGQVPRLLESLRVEDLALALGCARGNEQAWETFSWGHRSAVYEAACAYCPDIVRARELCDAVVAELYGVDPDSSERHSKLVYFHGRSSLKTWLRALVYRKFVDEYRRRSREEPLPENLEVANPDGKSISESDDQRYVQLLSEAVGVTLRGLQPTEKLLLSYYYLQRLTLKQIGRLTGEHEATVSRHMEALRKRLQKTIEDYLRVVKKLSSFDLDRCLEFGARGLEVDLPKVLEPD